MLVQGETCGQTTSKEGRKDKLYRLSGGTKDEKLPVLEVSGNISPKEDIQTRSQNLDKMEKFLKIKLTQMDQKI